jgi:hypothetical protein
MWPIYATCEGRIDELRWWKGIAQEGFQAMGQASQSASTKVQRRRGAHGVPLISGRSELRHVQLHNYVNWIGFGFAGSL